MERDNAETVPPSDAVPGTFDGRTAPALGRASGPLWVRDEAFDPGARTARTDGLAVTDGSPADGAGRVARYRSVE